MLKIDCLLLNTDYVKSIGTYMKYLGAEMMESNGIADFEAMYDRLTKDGLELDLETAGQLYIDAFKDAEGFSSVEDVEAISGRELDRTFRNLLLDDAPIEAEGEEKRIGKLSPTQNIAARLVRAFKSKDIVDEGAKSTLRQIQDWYADTLGRMTDKKTKEQPEDTRTWEEKIQDGLDKMNVGYRDVDGLIHNLETMHKDVDRQLKELTDDLRAKGKDVEAAQWEEYTRSFEDAVYSIALNKKEAREIVEGALVKKGYAKVNKKGEIDIDWDKASSHTSSLQQIRENVIEAITDAGHPKEIAERIADNLQREFLEVKTRMLEKADAKMEASRKTWDRTKATKSTPTIESVLNDAIRGWDNYRKLAEKPDTPLVMSKKTAKDVFHHILKETGFVDKGKVTAPRLSLDKLAEAVSSPDDIRKIAKDYLTDTMGFSEEAASAASEAMSEMYGDMIDKAREHVQGAIEAVENTWLPKTSITSAKKTLSDIINQRLNDLKKRNKLSSTQIDTPSFKKTEARDILSEALSNTDEYGRDVKGVMQVDWKKLSVKKPTEANMRDMVKAHMESLGYSPEVAERIAESIKDIYPEMANDISRHAEATLQAREEADLRKAPERKSALATLAELNALGVFEGGKERLLNKAISVSDVTTEDLASIKRITEAYTEAASLTGPMYGDNLQVAMERDINDIVARNQGSKTKLLRAARLMHDWFSLHNFTLISGPYNLMQNTLSGIESLMAASAEVKHQTGSGKFKYSKLWWDTLKDVSMGAPSNDASAKFGHTQAMDKLNTLDFKKSPAKALGTATVIMFRAALNGMDAANKAVIRNKAFIVNIHEALVRDGWTKEDATDFIYEMMWGQNRENVRKQAEKIIENFGAQMGVGTTKAAKERAITRLTDDMVKGNIELGTELGYNMGAKPPITAATVEAAFKAAKHGAGVALGHESNNPFSESQTAARQAAQRKYEAKIKKGDYNKAAIQSIVNTVYYDGIRRLATGGANWMVLTLEGTGLRLPSAVMGYKKANKKIWDVSDPKAMQEAITDRTIYQKQISRGLFGLVKSAVALGGMAALGAAVRDEDSDEGVMEAAAGEIKRSNYLSKVYKRTAGALGLLFYMNAVSKGQEEGKALGSAMEFATEISNSNPVYSSAGKLVRASQQSYHGDVEKSRGTIGSVVGDIAPGIPILPAYTKLQELGKEIFTGEAAPYDPTQAPLGYLQGYLYRGMIHKMANQFTEDQMQAVGFDNYVNWSKRED